VTETTETAEIETVPRPVVGILGGMGPLATADFYAKLIAATPASRDQGHLPVVMWADPTVPDRTGGLEGGADPTPWLVRGGRNLAAMGATMIAMPCNTAHAYLPRVQPQVSVPFLHMIGETAAEAATRYPGVERVGLLATVGTVRTGIYAEWFAKHHIEMIAPDEAHQAQVMVAIHRVKAGDAGPEATALVVAAAEYLVAHGAAALIAGCTELPLIFRDGDAAVPVLDPTHILAQAAVRRAGQKPN